MYLKKKTVNVSLYEYVHARYDSQKVAPKTDFVFATYIILLKTTSYKNYK